MAAELISHVDVRNEVTAPSLNEVQYELNRLTTTSPTEEELSKAKRYLVGSEALLLPDRASLAQRLATLWVHEHERGGCRCGGAEVLRSLPRGNYRRG